MRHNWLKLACAACAVLAALVFLRPDQGELRECPAEPKTGKWYSLTPGGAVSADGSEWQGRIRFGSENKLMLYFLGGGVSFDEYSAARSYTAVGGDAFYYDRDDGVSERRIAGGICKDADENPFRDWTIAVFPYTTADFHVGAGEVEYTGLDGRAATLRHGGYTNYAAMLERLLPMVGTPDALLITGYSAGGFAAAMLADDAIAHFPDTQNITVCVDGALLINENWNSIAAERWHAPDQIVEKTVSDNLTLDHLLALNDEHGDKVKILFASSLRDGALAMYQNYMDGGAYAPTEEYGEKYKQNLTVMVQALQREIEDAGIFIWDGIPYSNKEGSALTRHTILYIEEFFQPLQDGASIAQWIESAVEGKVESHGLALLGE